MTEHEKDGFSRFLLSAQARVERWMVAVERKRSPNYSASRTLTELWLLTGAASFLVWKIGSFHNQFPDYMMIIYILLGFAAVGTLGAVDRRDHTNTSRSEK